MRRQGWALSLGMIVSGSLLAQPPADEERFPPAPMLPGVVVSKPAGSPESPTTSFGIQRTNGTTTTVPAVPVPAPMPLPAPTVTAISTPVASPCATAACPAPVCPTPTCPTTTCATGHSGSFSHLPEWLKFRSQAKQSGHVPYPYTPQLYAWFPPGCVTNKPGVHGSATPCTTGHCGTTTVLPQPYTGPIPNAMTPMHVGSAQPMPVYTPGPLPVPSGVTTTPAEPDHLAGFRKINDGLLFTPGGSPMAAPVKPVSRPK